MKPQDLAKFCTREVRKRTGITLACVLHWRHGRVRKVHPAYFRAVMEAHHALQQGR